MSQTANTSVEPQHRRTDTVSLVIPAKDEARNIAWVLRRLPDGIDEVILVDGHSTDDTVAIAREIRPDIVVVDEEAPGKGAAMRTGMATAQGDVIVLIDADGSMDPRELDGYVEAARYADLVKGSRFAPRGGSDDISFLRRFGNASLRMAVNVLYGARLTDLCYGFCAVRRSALPAMALRSDGFEIETEMTVCALRAGLTVTEVPSFEAPRRYGESHLRTMPDGWRVLRTLLVERFRRPEPLLEPAAAAAGGAALSAVDPALATQQAGWPPAPVGTTAFKAAD
jgi:glycosyltransferase involved in cell wall biosynthesis